MAKSATAPKENSAEIENFQAESDLRTLIEAEKIRGDKKRMGALMKKHKDMSDALASINEENAEGDE